MKYLALVSILLIALGCGDSKTDNNDDTANNVKQNNDKANNGGMNSACIAEVAQSGGQTCGGSLGECPSITCTCANGVVSTSSCSNGTCQGSEACERTCADGGGGWECACQPSCQDSVCGDDGCGGSCGTCSEGSCSDGKCVTNCTPSCGDSVCGDDGCGGSCGTCNNGSCSSGKCVSACQKTCGENSCGDDDGCGGECDSCSVAGEVCFGGSCGPKPTGACFLEYTKSGIKSYVCGNELTSCLNYATQADNVIGGRRSETELIFFCECGGTEVCAPEWWPCGEGETSCVR